MADKYNAFSTYKFSKLTLLKNLTLSTTNEDITIAPLLKVMDAHVSSNGGNITLRHYDRIGLVKPSKKDEWTHYRYYTEQDIVRLNTIRALQLMDLPLKEIKKVLEYNHLEKIIDFLEKAEKKADEKIASLQYGKSKIQLAKADYQRKLLSQQAFNGFFLKEYPERVILLSNNLEMPTIDNLWNYLSHFYEQITPDLKDQFTFEDLAGLYKEKEITRLFAVCKHYTEIDGLKKLPKGKYLCAHCTEDNKEQILKELMNRAKITYDVIPSFSIQFVIVSGILYWNYEVQVYIGN